jgi:hypothetical protein
MVAFTGIHAMWSPMTPAQIFDAVTSPAFLCRWLSREMANIRVQGGEYLGEGVRFLADDPLGTGVNDMDHIYEVHRCHRPHIFALRQLGGANYSGELVLAPQQGGTRLQWTCSASPGNPVDTLLANLLRSRVRADTQRMAERDLARLIELSQERGETGSTEPASERDPDMSRSEARPSSLAAPPVAGRGDGKSDSAGPDEVDDLLRRAVVEAQEAGDRLLGGQHILLAMWGTTDSTGLAALRWAGGGMRAFLIAGLRSTSQAREHEGNVPTSPGLQQALGLCRSKADGRPFDSAAVLAALMHFGEPGAVQTVTEAGLRPQDILDAVRALAYLGKVDAVADEIAREPRTPPARPLHGRHEPPDHHGMAQKKDPMPAQPPSGWSAPEREAALAYREFQLALTTGLYLALKVATLIAAVAAANGHWWMLLLIPLLGAGNPLTGSAAMLPVACLYWWLGVPIVAWLVLAAIPLDAVMGALTQLRSDVLNHPVRTKDDLRIRTRHGVIALFHHRGLQNIRQAQDLRDLLETLGA